MHGPTTLLPGSQVDTGPADIGLAILLFGVGALLAKSAYEEYKEATDQLAELNERRMVMARVIHEHNLNVTQPFIKCAMDMMLAIPIPAPDYGGMCAFFNDLMLKSLAAARQGAKEYLALFCIKGSKAQRQLDYFSGLGAVDGAYARTRFQERREERIRETRTRLIQAAHAGTFKSPSAFFGLIENAAQIYGHIQTQSFNNLSGALATMSYGFSGLFNGNR